MGDVESDVDPVYGEIASNSDPDANSEVIQQYRGCSLDPTAVAAVAEPCNGKANMAMEDIQ